MEAPGATVQFPRTWTMERKLAVLQEWRNGTPERLEHFRKGWSQ